MLTKNLYQQVGLVNGIRGQVVELVFADDGPRRTSPFTLSSSAEGTQGGNWSSQERYRGCVPISPEDTTWQDGGTQVRTQLPLRLCWAKRHIGCIPPVVPLAITRTNGPWTHTSDDSYIYQLSLVLATAIVPPTPEPRNSIGSHEKKIGCTCVSSTKLDFSVGSFDFRLQVEADHHGATKHTQQTTRAKNSSTHR